jgi:hypothetical protein
LFGQELLELVHGWSCLALASARGLCGTLRARATCLLVDANIIIGCDLLAALFVPLLAGLGTLLGTLDGDASPLLPRVGRSWVALVLVV